MLTPGSRNHDSFGKYGLPSVKLRHVASSKPTRVLLITVLLVALIITFGHKPSYRSNPPLPPLRISTEPPKKARFSLLVPATSSNADLCKLLLSGQILKYPTPILINYGATEFEDPYVQHLAKVEGIMKYLDRLESSDEYAEDLVLIVDGFDIWFQLPPEVLLRRYYEVNAAANARLIETYGGHIVSANDIRQTIVFGPDKICWPTDFNRPACWAVSSTDLDEYAFGPETSGKYGSRSQPRWLNSGTILGPVQDLKDFFQATLEAIRANHTTDSDQFYMAEVFGRQEFARLQHQSKLLESYKSVRFADEVDNATIELARADASTAGVRSEYHIGIDYQSAMFQTLAYWKQYLAWMRPSDSYDVALGQQATHNSPYSLRLRVDIAESPAPFSDLLKNAEVDADLPRSWNDVELLYNTVTHEVPAMIHFTGEKRFRHIWWKKIWFQSRAKQLREATIRVPHKHNEPFGPIGGFVWYNAESPDAEDVHMHGVGGAWSDRGGWFSWKSLCAAFEDNFYEIPGDGLFHNALHDEADNIAVDHAEADAAPGEAAFQAGNWGTSGEAAQPDSHGDVGNNIVEALRPH